MKKQVTTAVVIFLITFFLLADQTLEQTVSQLEKKLATVSGKEKVDVLVQISKSCIYISSDKCISTGLQALELAKELGYTEGEALAYNYTAIGHAVAGDNAKGLELLTLAKKKYQEIGDVGGVARILNNMGIIYRRTGSPQKALVLYKEALAIQRDQKKEPDILLTLGNIGNVYSDMAFPEEALKYFLEALSIYEETGDRQGIARNTYSIALQYMKLDRDEESMEYVQKAQQLFREQGNKTGTADSMLCIATLHKKSGNFTESLHFNRQALKLAEESGYSRGRSYALGNIGEIFRRQKQYHKALEFYHRTLGIEKKSNDRIKLGLNLNEIGLCYIYLKEYSNARENLLKALALGEEIGNKNVMKISCGHLSHLYNATGDYKKALKYHQRFHRIHKEILDEKTSRQITEMQARYDTLKKEKENEVLKRENKINQLNLGKAHMIRNALIAGIALVLTVLALLFRRYMHFFTFWKKEKHIGNFRLMEKLGSGAMGTIYKARSMARKSDIAAVKVLKDELFADPGQRSRFKREAIIIDKLDHPNIVKVYEAGSEVDQKKLFIVMEYLEGRTLEQRLVQDGHIPTGECIHIMAQVAGAITCIHERKIVHRDLKPGNIMLVEKDGDPNFVKLLDFGLARLEFHTRLTQTGNFVGTIEYVAPEQIMGALSIPANDIFSMGVILYRLLTGRTPFQGESVAEVMRQLIAEEPVPATHWDPEINDNLNRLIMLMISREPEKRPTAAEVRESLAQIRL